MKLKIKEGTTSKLVRVFIQDSSATDGSGLTGLLYNSAGLTAHYLPEGDATPVSITLQTMTVGTWATGGFKEVDSINMPGLYEIGLPDAVIDATSEGSVIVMLKGATNMVPLPIEIELDKLDYRSTSWNGDPIQYLDASVAANGTAIGTVGGQVNLLSNDVSDGTFNILAAISGITTVGSGAISWEVLIQVSGLPIEGAEVWVTTDLAGTNVIAGTLTTDSNGLATFMLDAGTYYLWVQKNGTTFTNPTTITVA